MTGVLEVPRTEWVPGQTAMPVPGVLRIGSLFSGYEGLGMAVQQVLGGELAWVSDIDPGACKILAHRFPEVPNIGDIAAVDWAAVDPVDVLTGGFPCQDVSAAGRRLGMKPGTRSGLWSQMAYAISVLRPSLVVIENVRGLLSARAGGQLEPCPWCVGDDEGVPLRALGGVLGDLAGLGYDASWVGLRAADVGAPHGRFRVFVVAQPPADPAQPGRQGPGGEPVSHGRPVAARRSAAADAPRDRRDEGRSEPAGQLWGPDAALSGAPAAADADRAGLGRVGWVGAEGHDADRRDGAHGDGHEDEPAAPAADPDGVGRRADLDVLRPGEPHAEWGPYRAAVRRWEQLTRPAPAPTEPGKTGPRLSPVFVEWLMGLPAGHVTAVPGLSRAEKLKALGNGVVPQQAAAALRVLLADVGSVAA